MNGRKTRRMLGHWRARLHEARLGDTPDARPRHKPGRALRSILNLLVVAMAAGRRSLREVEDFSAEMTPHARRLLGVDGRIPDTTMRDVLVRLEPDSLRARLHRVVRRAHRRHAIAADELPFGVVSMDGRATAIGAWDDRYSQRQLHGGSASGACGLVRTVTSVLATSRARPCIDISPVPPATNEDGHFVRALDELLAAYQRLDLFRMVAYDSGACSKSNADAVRERHLHYLFCLDDKQPTLCEEARRLLSCRPVEQADATSEERTGRGIERRYLFMTSEMAGFHGWAHLSTTLRVRREVWGNDGELVQAEDRYLVASLAADRLTAKQWLRLVRIRWAVENEGHHTFDTAFAEDDHPWIEADPQGTVVLMVVRRIAYTLCALFRSVTLRSEESHSMPWKDLLRWAYLAFASAGPLHVAGLRPRRSGACEA